MEVRRPLSSICRGTGTYSGEVVGSPLPRKIDYNLLSCQEVHKKQLKLPDIRKPVHGIPKTYVTRRGALLLFADSYRIWRQKLEQQNGDKGDSDKKDMAKILKTLKELRKLVLSLGLDDDYAIKGLSAILHPGPIQLYGKSLKIGNESCNVRLWHPKLVDKYLDGDSINKTLVQKYFDLILPDVTVDGLILKHTLFGSNPQAYSKSKLVPLKMCHNASCDRGDQQGDIPKKPEVMVLPRIDLTNAAELEDKNKINRRMGKQNRTKFWSNYETLSYDEKADLLYRMLTSRDENPSCDNEKLSRTLLQKEALHSKKCVFPVIKIEESCPTEKPPKSEAHNRIENLDLPMIPLIKSECKKSENNLELPAIHLIKSKSRKVNSKSHTMAARKSKSPLLSACSRTSDDVGSTGSSRLPKFVYKPTKLTCHGISHSDQFLTRNRSRYVHGKHLCIKGMSLASQVNVPHVDMSFYVDQDSNSSSSSHRSDLSYVSNSYTNLSSVTNIPLSSSRLPLKNLKNQHDDENIHLTDGGEFMSVDRHDEENIHLKDDGEFMRVEFLHVDNSPKYSRAESSVTSAQSNGSTKRSADYENSFYTNSSFQVRRLTQLGIKSDASFSTNVSSYSTSITNGTESLPSICKGSDVSKKAATELYVASTVFRNQIGDIHSRNCKSKSAEISVRVENKSALSTADTSQLSDTIIVEKKRLSKHTISPKDAMLRPAETSTNTSPAISSPVVDNQKFVKSVKEETATSPDISSPSISSAVVDNQKIVKSAEKETVVSSDISSSALVISPVLNNEFTISNNEELAVNNDMEVERRISLPYLVDFSHKNDNSLVVDDSVSPDNVALDLNNIADSNNEDCSIPTNVCDSCISSKSGGGSGDDSDTLLHENKVTDYEVEPVPLADSEEMDILVPFTDILSDISEHSEGETRLCEQSVSTRTANNSSSDDGGMRKQGTAVQEDYMQISGIGGNLSMTSHIDGGASSGQAIPITIDNIHLNVELDEGDDKKDEASLFSEGCAESSGKQVDSVHMEAAEEKDQLNEIIHDILSRPDSGLNFDEDLKAAVILKEQRSIEIASENNASLDEESEGDALETILPVSPACLTKSNNSVPNDVEDFVEEERILDPKPTSTKEVEEIGKPDTQVEEKVAEQPRLSTSDDKLSGKNSASLSENDMIDDSRRLKSEKKVPEKTLIPPLKEKAKEDFPASVSKVKAFDEIPVSPLKTKLKEETEEILLDEKVPNETPKSVPVERAKEETTKPETPFHTGNPDDEKPNFLGSDSKNNSGETKTIEKKKGSRKKPKEEKKNANKNKVLPPKNSSKNVTKEPEFEKSGKADTKHLDVKKELPQKNEKKILKTSPPLEEKVQQIKESDVDMKTRSSIQDDKSPFLRTDFTDVEPDRSRSSSSDEFVISRSPEEIVQENIKPTIEVKKNQPHDDKVEVKTEKEPDKLAIKQMKRQQSAEARRAMVENKRKLEEKRRREKEEKRRETELYFMQAQEEEMRKEQMRLEMEEDIRKQEEARKKAEELEKQRLEEEKLERIMQEEKAEKLRKKRLKEEEARRKKMEMIQAERQMEMEFKKAQEEMAKAIEADMAEKERLLMEQMEENERALYEAEKKLEEALRRAEDEERARRMEEKQKEEEKRRQQELEELSKRAVKMKFTNELERTGRLMEIQQQISRAYTYSYFNLLPIILYGADTYPLKIIRKVPTNLSELLAKMETIPDRGIP